MLVLLLSALNIRAFLRKIDVSFRAVLIAAQFFILPIPLCFALDYSDLSPADQLRWLAIGHYESRLIRGYQSRIDDGDFFMSELGKTDPAAEFRASWDAIATGSRRVGLLKQTPACAFPARLAFFRDIRSQDFDHISDESCTDYIAWKKGLDAERITLIFSSAYAYNPASAFGHSFLRIDAKKNDQSGELLQYGINYEARMDDLDRNFAYVYKAFLGGYPGQFSIAPYYMKVQEYNHSEGRDLWEYPLNLSAREVDALIEAVWEVFANASADYYFQDENCSHMILALLDIARPELGLTSKIGWPVVPADMIRVVVQSPGLVSKVYFRASKKRIFLQEYAALDQEQRSDFASITADDGQGYGSYSLGGLTLAQKYFLLKKHYENPKEKEPSKAKLHRLQLKIAESDSSTLRRNDKEYYEIKNPSIKHKRTSRVDLGLGRLISQHGQANLVRTSVTAFSDDVLDVHEEEETVVAWSLGKIEFTAMKDRGENTKVYLSEAVLADLFSAEAWHPYTEHMPSMRYKIWFHADGSTREQQQISGEFGFGYGLDLAPKLTAYAMLGTRLDLGMQSESHRVEIPLWTGILWTPIHWRVRGFSEYEWHYGISLDGDHSRAQKARLKLRYILDLNQSIELLTWIEDKRKISTELNYAYYF
jgi:hypothetical protein